MNGERYALALMLVLLALFAFVIYIAVVFVLPYAPPILQGVRP